MGFINIFAGLLTFSTAFFIGLVVYWLINNINKKLLLLSLFLFVLIIIYISISDFNSLLNISFLNFSSFGDRLIRAQNGFNILLDTSTLNDLLLGHGITYKGNDKGLSIGLFLLLVEHGILGFLGVFLLLLLFLRNSNVSYCMFLLFILVFPWYVSHIYWIGALVLFSVTYTDNNGNKF
jgi:hypothetical protein